MNEVINEKEINIKKRNSNPLHLPPNAGEGRTYRRFNVQFDPFVDTSKGICISAGNMKIGSCANFNLPPRFTCRPDAPCAGNCYACKAYGMYPNTKNSYDRNLVLYMRNPKAVFNEIDCRLTNAPQFFFRWHTSGDIVDAQYLELMCWVARKHKETKFLCFTKKFELVNEYFDNHTKPGNLIIVFSNWGKFVCENPHNFPCTYVKLKKGECEIPKNSIECNGHCEGCHECWKLGKGESVFFHEH